MKNKSKFNTKLKNEDRPKLDGYIFASELELRFYAEEIKPNFGGTIESFMIHPNYKLQDGYIKDGKKVKPVYYFADFVITYFDGATKVIDIKGMATETALLKRKWFDAKYPNKTLLWLCYSKIDGGWIEFDKLKKERAKRKKEKLIKKGVG